MNKSTVEEGYAVFIAINVTDPYESWHDEYKNSTRRTEITGSPGWLFVAVFAIAAILVIILSFLILTYYRKMMFAEFALAAINWRHHDSITRQKTLDVTSSSVSSSSYLSVASAIDGLLENEVKDELEISYYRTPRCSGRDGDHSGYEHVDQTNNTIRQERPEAELMGNGCYNGRRDRRCAVGIFDDYL